MNFMSNLTQVPNKIDRSELGSSPYGPNAPRPHNKINIGNFMRDIQEKDRCPY